MCSLSRRRHLGSRIPERYRNVADLTAAFGQSSIDYTRERPRPFLTLSMRPRCATPRAGGACAPSARQRMAQVQRAMPGTAPQRRPIRHRCMLASAATWKPFHSTSEPRNRCRSVGWSVCQHQLRAWLTEPNGGRRETSTDQRTGLRGVTGCGS